MMDNCDTNNGKSYYHNKIYYNDNDSKNYHAGSDYDNNYNYYNGNDNYSNNHNDDNGNGNNKNKNINASNDNINDDNDNTDRWNPNPPTLILDTCLLCKCCIIVI